MPWMIYFSLVSNYHKWMWIHIACTRYNLHIQAFPVMQLLHSASNLPVNIWSGDNFCHHIGCPAAYNVSVSIRHLSFQVLWDLMGCNFQVPLAFFQVLTYSYKTKWNRSINMAWYILCYLNAIIGIYFTLFYLCISI